VKHNIHIIQRLSNRVLIANIGLDELSSRIQISRAAAWAMNLRHQRIKDTNVMTLLNERIHKMRANEARPTCNQYI
jgi:hypothetical protein